jgi:hypothetical protein
LAVFIAFFVVNAAGMVACGTAGRFLFLAAEFREGRWGTGNDTKNRKGLLKPAK